MRFLVLVAFLVREYWLAIRQYRAGALPSSWYDRSNLPPGSAQQPAASIRAAVGNAIARTYRRPGFGPAHKDRLEPSRAVVAFGGTSKRSRPANTNFVDQAIMAFRGSTKGSRPGLPARGPQSWENPNILPGAIGDIAETSAAPAMALLLSRQKIADAPPPTPGTGDRAPARPVACVLAIRALAEMFPIWDQYRSADRTAAVPGSQFSCA